MKAFSLVGLSLLAFSMPAFSNVTVTTPYAGATVTTPFPLIASATPCSSQPIAAMGYSLDNSTNTTIVYATSVKASVSASIGAHTLHVKSWGNLGASCVEDIAITVVASPTALVPTGAIAVYGIHKLNGWQAVTDAATGYGYSTGKMSLVNSPTLSGVTRQFTTAYTRSAGERYFVSFGKDTGATNFLYDVSIYVAAPSSDIANIEMDMNQVMANGQTVIYGVQCDGYTGTWDYTANEGSPEKPVDQWLHSTAPCNPRAWTTNTWHHVQISYSRDEEGNVNYKSVWFDGVKQNLDATVPSAFALGWGSTLLTNFQIDGVGGYGSSTVYMDNLTIYRW
jgi:hypothetical protein